jgi:hypothetical protein
MNDELVALEKEYEEIKEDEELWIINNYKNN